MARELVEKNGIGDSADAIWKTLHQEHQKLFAATGNTSDTAPDELSTETSAPQDLITSAINMEPVLIFGQRPESLTSSRKRSRQPIPEQPSLFSWN